MKHLSWVLLISMAFGQQAMIPTNKEYNRLKTQHDRFIKLQTQILNLQAKEAHVQQEWAKECSVVAATHGWTGATCDFNTITFQVPAPPQQHLLQQVTPEKK